MKVIDKAAGLIKACAAQETGARPGAERTTRVPEPRAGRARDAFHQDSSAELLNGRPVGIAASTPAWVDAFNRTAPPRPARLRLTHPPCAFNRRPPAHAEPRLHWRLAARRHVALPPSFCALLPDARVWGDEGAVVAPDGALLADVSAAFARPPERHPIFAAAPLPAPRPLPGRSLLLTARGGFRNYYHWLLDVLPRLHLAEAAGWRLADFDHVIVSSQRLPYQRETLRRLGVARRQVVESVREPHLLAEELVLPSLARHQGETMPWSVGWLGRVFAPELGAAGRVPGGGRRLYSSRGDARYRRVENEAELWGALRGLGFERVEAAALTVSEQARVFGEADVVVGAHGANLTNVVFCPAGAHVVEIFSPTYVIPPVWGLCTLKGLQYSYVVGEGEDFPQEEDRLDLLPDVRVDVEKVLRLLARVLD